jgi:hypothetical protein
MGKALTDGWWKFGALPAFQVTVAVYVLAVIDVVLFSKPVAEGVGVGLFAVSVLYCLARDRAGWEVFGLMNLPGAVGGILSSVGAPPWIGLVLVPVSLLGLWAVDRQAEAPGAPVT